MSSATFRRAVAVATTAAATCALALVPITAAGAAVVPSPVTYSAEDASLALTPLGSFETGVFDESAAEIVATHGDRLFVVNAQAGSVSVLDWSDPTAMTELFAIASTGTANSVAVREDGLGVIAFEAEDKTAAGSLVFFDADAADEASAVLGSVTVGALPDMVAISADGTYAVVANEGEPADDYTSDPEGSLGVVTLPSTKTAPAQGDVRTADFRAYEADGGKTLPEDVRVFGPTPESDLPVSRNLEPEYIAIDGDVAYAALQENNAIAVVDLASATVQDIWALGFKDHSVAGNGLDASDRDPEDASTVNIDTYAGLFGVYQPDGMDIFAANGSSYLVTANEGDAREWGDYVEPERVKDLDVCADSPAAALTEDEDLGRLEVTTELGFDEEGDCYSALYAHGARSFSIWSTDGTQVFDSGDDFEQITAAAAPGSFNFSNDDNDAGDFDSRSDAKGPEPEGVVIGEVGDRTYAFIGLERVGGVMVYDITTPAAAEFVTYVNNRDVSADAESSAAGDLGPEGLAFVAAADSPTGEPALIVGNEVSGTTTVFGITDLLAPETTEIQVLTINDFHGRLEGDSYGVAGAAVIGGAVAEFEAANPNTLFVSAGDNIGGSTFTSASQDDLPSIDALVEAGLDVGAVGNHEFDKGFDFLLDTATPRFGAGDAAAGATYSLGANVYAKGTENPVLEEYSIADVDGVRVAFIGTVTPDTAVMVSPDGIADIEFGDQLVAANRVAAEITEDDLADVIILLTHDGAATDACESLISDDTDYSKLVAGASDDIDAIASGHTHQEYACMLPTPGGGERPVIQALEYGKALGLLDISVDTETKELVSIEGSVVPLTDGGTPLYPADPEVAA
ncbi:choice-of-anchor I family protein, partial [Microbacterium xanthum]|uniref:choice-of-anchor I family protein n=1 Tax=Microbacterium xanthum TaxID=3079794 RepID=UPI002AD456BA